MLSSAFLALALTAPVADTTPWDSVALYQERSLEGWTLLVHQDLYGENERALCEATFKELRRQLVEIVRVVPPRALAELRKVPIWIEKAHPRHPCMCYHVSPSWLRQHGMNPQKAHAVELANAANFCTWTKQQPWMVLHELAHAYHDRVLGFGHAEVKAAYEQAKASKTYDSVGHWDGKKVRHYALTNDHEYFAEATEAYFGKNDYYPFVRTELKSHDPRGYALIEKLWGVSP